MGNVKSQLDPKDVEDYVTLSYLTHREIYRLFERFKEVDVETIGKDKDARIPIEQILQATKDGSKKVFPEFQCNPFSDRLLAVFSSNDDGCLSFEDFIDLVSAFSENADESLKAAYAFQIFDFDSDHEIGTDDVEEIIVRLTGAHHAIGSRQGGTENSAFYGDERFSGSGHGTGDYLQSEHDRGDSRAKRRRQSAIGGGLSEENIRKVVQLVMQEADLRSSGKITLQEFIHLSSKLPDFASSFTIRF